MKGLRNDRHIGRFNASPSEQRFINIANQALQAEDVAMSAVRDFLCYGKWMD
jgi:hypothetical protein